MSGERTLSNLYVCVYSIYTYDICSMMINYCYIYFFLLTVQILDYVLFVLYRYTYRLCVNVYYCHRVTIQLQLTNISSYIIIKTLK